MRKALWIHTCDSIRHRREICRVAKYFRMRISRKKNSYRETIVFYNITLESHINVILLRVSVNAAKFVASRNTSEWGFREKKFIPRYHCVLQYYTGKSYQCHTREYPPMPRNLSCREIHQNGDFVKKSYRENITFYNITRECHINVIFNQPEIALRILSLEYALKLRLWEHLNWRLVKNNRHYLNFEHIVVKCQCLFRKFFIGNGGQWITRKYNMSDIRLKINTDLCAAKLQHLGPKGAVCLTEEIRLHAWKWGINIRFLGKTFYSWL